MGRDLWTNFLDFQEDHSDTTNLSRPRPEVPLLLYLLVANEVVSSASAQEEGKH